MINLREIDLGCLNSATKYPSILTYHEMGERGRLRDAVQVPFDATDEVLVTEKVDGTNARVILLPGPTYVIGSREEFLHARGDIICNEQLGIVEAVRPWAEKALEAVSSMLAEDVAVVLYGEAYGGKISGGKNYTGSGATGFRLFDIVEFIDTSLQDILAKPREEIARWRDHGGQDFVPEAALLDTSDVLGIAATPRLTVSSPPTSISATLEWLGDVCRGTRVALDDGARGNPEGVVIRTRDRTKIAKVRFEDYERTLGKRK